MTGLLFLKMCREIRRSAGTYGVCILVIAIGFCGYSVLGIASEQLADAGRAFYTLSAYPEVIAEVELAPLQAVQRLLTIDGLERVEGRLTESLTVLGLPDQGRLQQPELKLVSIGPEKMAVPLLSRGQMPRENERELVIGNNFFTANGLTLGQEIGLAVNGRRMDFSVCGSGISPENIYMLKSMADMFPDPAGYDSGFVDYATLAALTGRQGMVNEFLIMLRPGVAFADVRDAVRAALEPYGCYRVYPREDQSSIAMLESELEQLAKMTLVLPFIFLSVAAVILYISLNRMVQQQRLQIGVMLALGLRPKTVRRHYLGYGAAIGFAGGTFGILLGYAVAGPMVDFYRTYFSLPDITVPPPMSYMYTGPAMATVFCALIGWSTAWSLGKLLPAESLRPPAPKEAGPSLFEKIPLISRALTVPGLMALRGVTRNRRRSLLSVCGIAMAFMVTATLVSMYTLFDVFLFDSLSVTQRQDISVGFRSPVDRRQALAAIRHPAVEYAEGIMEFGGRLRGPKGELDTALQGIEQDSRLCYLYDEAKRQIFVQPEGIVISVHIANLLGAGPGDYIEMEVEYPQKKLSRIQVTGVAAQYVGSTAYLSHEAVAKVSDYGGACTSLLIKGAEDASKEIALTFSAGSMAGLVIGRREKLDAYRRMMGNLNGMMASMAMIGVVIGLAVIYVSSLISFEELKREVAVMLTLGLKSRQCLEVISVEQWILTAAGICAGIPLTVWMSALISASIATDMYSIPNFVDTASLVQSMALTAAAVWLSGRLMHRKIRKITPVDLLRERE